jgi:dephospho-CoA kinase
MIIGVTGRIASGKGYLASYLAENGFKKLTISSFIKDELIKRNLPLTRENYQDVGDEVRKKEGTGAWIKRMNLGEGHYVVDGLRNPGEIAELKKSDDFYLVAVDAPQRMRYERTVSRKTGDSISWKDFAEQDNREVSEKDSSKMQLNECIGMADFKILNDGSLQEFESKIDEIYTLIRRKVNKK